MERARHPLARPTLPPRRPLPQLPLLPLPRTKSPPLRRHPRLRRRPRLDRHHLLPTTRRRPHPNRPLRHPSRLLLVHLLPTPLPGPQKEIPSPNLLFDYVLYLGSLVWSVELAYLENRFHLLSGQWDLYLLATAALYFLLAYRFDNRFVLSLALSSLAAWFGLTISHIPSHQDATYRQYAIVYSLFIGAAGAITHRRSLKPHFFGTYLNIAANVLFWALLSGVFVRQNSALWLLALLAACAASLAWGISRRQFSFVAYAAVYGYIGISSILLREHE